MKNSKEIPETPKKLGENAKNHFKDLLKYVSCYKVSIFFVILFSLTETLAAVVSPKVAGLAITAISGAASGGIVAVDFNYVFKILAILAALYSVYALSSCVGSYIITSVTVKITYRLREDISKKISRLPLSYIESSSRGDILSRTVNDVETLSSAFTESINKIISSTVLLVGILVMMFSISWELTLISLGIVPAVGVLVLIIIKKSQKYFEKYQKDLGEINGFTEETFSGYETVKIFNAESKTKDKFNSFNDNMYNSSWKSQFISGSISPVMGLVTNLSYVSTCLVGGYFAVVRGFAIGDISAFIAYSGQFNQPLLQFAGISSLLQQTLAAADRVFEFLHMPEESQTENKNISYEIPFNLNDKNLKCSIEFKNVNFGYDSSKRIIENFSFKIPSGKSVAVVGETGAGKTTLTNLLMRFYKIESGEITLNSVDINKLNLSAYRKLFGVVTQDAMLYNASIAENIKYGNLSASFEKIKQAAEFVGAHHFIQALPDGYETVIKEDSDNISAGQKQLICIARAVISDSPIIILDEATSSIDTCTENRIQKALDKMLRGKTSIVIAHRLSTIKNCDIIAVMDKGRLSEFGTHEELFESNGYYHSLYMSQFENV